ncbi:MAG: hypothetical protein KF884_12645 [Fimbriimonadaceae bacterium]|nr:hypothetical protein [Fimbriimonadaceae bacterium]QYK58390.1 MAG: hypothetical protein KF884_12645 [Fimbriimonadaceae bacterium]
MLATLTMVMTLAQPNSAELEMSRLVMVPVLVGHPFGGVAVSTCAFRSVQFTCSTDREDVIRHVRMFLMVTGDEHSGQKGLSVIEMALGERDQQTCPSESKPEFGKLKPQTMPLGSKFGHFSATKTLESVVSGY